MNASPVDSAPVAEDGLDWCPACGLGKQGRCEKCRGGIGSSGVVERVFCMHRDHETAAICPGCKRRGARAGAVVTKVVQAVKQAPREVPPDPDELVMFDTETTGRSKLTDRVIQVAGAIVRLPSFEVVDTFMRLCSPGLDLNGGVIPIQWQASKVHGLYDRDVVGKPTFDEVLSEFLAWCAGRPMAAHNAPFDREFIHESISRMGGSRPGVDLFCTIKIARAAFPKEKSHALPELAKSLGVELPRMHRADNDTAVMTEVLKRTLARTGKRLRELCVEVDRL